VCVGVLIVFWNNRLCDKAACQDYKNELDFAKGERVREMDLPLCLSVSFGIIGYNVWLKHFTYKLVIDRRFNNIYEKA
jgi:hypothetical protein